MRDGISFTKAGHPTIVIVHDRLERAARAQATALGLADLKIYVFPQHKASNVEPEEIRRGTMAAQKNREVLETRT